jgi:hypothetical protein
MLPPSVVNGGCEMRRKTWSAREIVETMQVQNYREMSPNMVAGGEGVLPAAPAGTAAAELLEMARSVGGEGSGTPG